MVGDPLSSQNLRGKLPFLSISALVILLLYECGGKWEGMLGVRSWLEAEGNLYSFILCIYTCIMHYSFGCLTKCILCVCLFVLNYA